MHYLREIPCAGIGDLFSAWVNEFTIVFGEFQALLVEEQDSVYAGNV